MCKYPFETEPSLSVPFEHFSASSNIVPEMFVVICPVLPWFLPSFLHETECDRLAFLRNSADVLPRCFKVCRGRTEIDRWVRHVYKIQKAVSVVKYYGSWYPFRLAVRRVGSYFEAAAFPVCSEMWRTLILWFLGFREPSFFHHLVFGSQVGSGLSLDAEDHARFI